MLEPSNADDAGVRRRSTWRETDATAPAGGTHEGLHDDDALADALAAEVAAVTSSIPVVRREAVAGMSSVDDLFAALMEEPDAPPAQSIVAPELEPALASFAEASVEPAIPVFETVLTPEGEPPLDRVPEPGVYLPSEPPRYEDGAEGWRDLALLPSADLGAFAQSYEQSVSATLAADAMPADAVPADTAPADTAPPPELIEPPLLPRPPAGSSTLAASSFGSLLHAAPPPAPGSMALPAADAPLPEPPGLRSLDDDSLAEVLNHTTATAGVAGALTELELQMQLREEDAQEFESWERALRAIGTGEALRRIETVREQMKERFTIPFAGDDQESVPATPEPEEIQPIDAFGSETAPHDTYSLESATEDNVPEEIGETDWAPFLAAPDGDAADVRSPISQPDPFAFQVPPATSVPAPAAVLRDDAPVLVEGVGARQRVFALEANEGEPTPLEYRAGRASRMFWQWFALNSSVVSIAAGAALFGLGMSVRQSLVALLVGVALSLLPLGLATLAGKWSSQPTMIVSRAAFGVVGNLLPAALAVLTRVFWAAMLLWVIGAGASAAIGRSFPGAAASWLPAVIVGGALLLAATVAVFGFALLVRLAAVLGVLSGVLVVGVVALTLPRLDLSAALAVADGAWGLVVAGSVLVFSVVGLAWANAGAEFARYQRPGGSGAGSIIWTMLGSAVPALALLGYGVVLASSEVSLAAALRSEPIAALTELLPSWYSLPLIAALVLSLLAGVMLSLYSGGFALLATGLRVPRVGATLMMAVAAGTIAVLLVLSTADLDTLLRDAVTTMAVPVAAWAGIFACDLMIRTERFDASALMRRGSTYGDINWANCGMLLLASLIGFGLTSASLAGLTWQGYLWPVLGIDPASSLAASDIGVLVALLLGLLTPLVSGVRRIRRQESSSR